MNAQLRTLSKAIKSLDRTAEPKQQQHTEEVHQEASPYPSINASDGETRLIELLPGAFSDQINVRLSRATITGCTEYDALSYVWGQEISTTPALVNGIPVKITVNLEGALRHLRKETASRIIWIDALSISQHDVNERNRQVQNMGTIYASARQVIIWLGDGAGDSEQVKPAFDFMKTGVFPTKEDPFFDLRSAFYYIRSSEWFDRVWVIQELVLATEDPIVYHRHDFVSWSQFCKGVLEMWQAILDANNPRTPGDAFSGRKDATDLGATIRKFFPGDGTAHFDSFSAFSDKVKRLEDIKLEGRHSSLPLLLSRTTHSRATDPRDKVFGLLGICTSAATLVMADYSKSGEQIFCEAMALVIREGFGFGYASLPLHRHRIGCPQKRQLPSWVPDLTMCQDCWVVRIMWFHAPASFCPVEEIESATAKSSSISPIYSFANNFRTLRTGGLYIGTIAKRMYVFHPGRQQQQPHLDALRSYADIGDIFRGSNISTQRILQALIGPSNPYRDILGQEDGQAAIEQLLYDNDRLLESFGESGFAKGSTLFNLHNAIATYTHFRTLFVTEERHVGVSYHPNSEFGIRQGDLLVGLFGINFPFILRPKQDCRSTTYEMINVAHVAEHRWGHDFIENAAPGTDWKDFEQYGLKEYVIV